MYGAGRNSEGQLGLGISNPKDQPCPTWINTLDNKHIVDIQSGEYHSLALSDNGYVYSTGHADEGQHGHGGAWKSGWDLIFVLRDTKIRQIAVGDQHSVFLDCCGVVLCCGRNSEGQLGLGRKRTNKSMLPTVIPVFQDQGIKIAKIAAGGAHTLAIDIECSAYA